MKINLKTKFISAGLTKNKNRLLGKVIGLVIQDQWSDIIYGSIFLIVTFYTGNRNFIGDLSVAF